MNKQQTAVEWLENEIWEHIEWKPQLKKRVIAMKFEQAKEMEKEQILDAYECGFESEHDARIPQSSMRYYNETYVGGEQ